MDWKKLAEDLLRAEDEGSVTQVLSTRGLLAAEMWRPVGGMENNFAIIGAQHSDPSGAFVEKAINCIDATLMQACYAKGLDPEGPDAPATMTAAVERFFGIKDGRLGTLPQKTLRELAQNIQIVALGAKESPSYVIVDQGEGQAPGDFPETFLSLAKSNKLRIPFVQGRFNAGGTGVLPFCGRENYQLILSRRDPACPSTDPARGDWGFTLIRRLNPTAADKRKNPVYVYFAPSGSVPSFASDSILVLPGDSAKNKPAEPYSRPLRYGTIVKLYNFRWKAKSIATTDVRFELEKYLQAPCLPVRIVETREGYRANFYSTTLSGIWAAVDRAPEDEENRRLEPGFPAPGELDIDGLGVLHYKIAVFREEVESRRLPRGVFFTVNGQVHGEAPADFVARRLQFEYLRSHLVVSVDAASMPPEFHYDFFMASRDRLRRDENYDLVLDSLQTELRDHPGLRELNAARKARVVQKALVDGDEVRETFQQLLEADPTLRELLLPGVRLTGRVGPTETADFKGSRFPTYFRPKKAPALGLTRDCPINRSIKVDFETDAVNDYLERAETPGELTVSPPSAYVDYRPWNGTFTMRFRPPRSASVGDTITVSVSVTDGDRAAKALAPFVSQLTIQVGAADHRKQTPGGDPNPSKVGPRANGQEAPDLAIPEIHEIRREQWNLTAFDPPFDEDTAFRVISDADGRYDFYLNVDGTYLVTQIQRAKDSDKDLVKYWYRWGLALSAIGILQHERRVKKDESDDELRVSAIDLINYSLSGVASVIVPIVRNLYKGPGPALGK